jgi:hypothetical protein
MKSVWDIAPFLQEEGTFTGKVLRIRSLETIGGAQLLIRLDGTELPEISNHTADLEKLEKQEKLNRVHGGAYLNEGFKYLLLIMQTKSSQLCSVS